MKAPVIVLNTIYDDVLTVVIHKICAWGTDGNAETHIILDGGVKYIVKQTSQEIEQKLREVFQWEFE